MASVLQFKNIVKVYENGVIANRGVNVDIRARTIHAIVGENGAGKTTLMRILFGMTQPQEGVIIYRGKEVRLRSPQEAIKLGIGMVHQHLMLAADLSVAENMVLGLEPVKGRIFLDLEQAEQISRQVSEKYGLSVPVDRRIRELPLGVRQRVEILKALFRQAELLILDEPTSVLTPQERETLFNTLRDLKAHGKTILFISHKLREVKSIADRITVMRGGRVITTREAGELSEQDLAYLMVGRKIDLARSQATPRADHPLSPPPARSGVAPPQGVASPGGTSPAGAALLSVRELSYVDHQQVRMLHRVSFDLRSGEILGLAGVEGNGQTELIRILAGLLTPSGGRITLSGRSLRGLSPRQIRALGVAHIPEDRMADGVAEGASVEENLIVDRYYKKSFSTGPRLLWDFITRHSRGLMEDFNILAQSPEAPVSSLSGGNIQKLVVARELSLDPQVIIAAQPTRGIDVGAEVLVHRLLREARDRGKAILLASADIDEILQLSTRIMVIYNGELVAWFSDLSGITARDLGPYMLGLGREQAAGAEGGSHV